MIPVATVEHRSSGRLRLRVRSRRGDGAYFAGVTARLSSVRGIRTLEAKPATGSILLQHSLDDDTLLSLAKEQDLFEVADPAPVPEPPFAAISRRYDEIDRWVSNATGGQADLSTALFGALAASALVQLARGNVGVPATTLLWYAGSVVLLARNDRRASLS